MKTSLSHLPHQNQQELKAIVNRIKSIAMPEKIILFGSYATGKNVNDRYVKDSTTFDYISDYDILVLYKESGLEYYEIEDKILQTYDYKAPLSLIILHVDVVNNQLTLGDYFLDEILDKGILLFDSGNTEFVEAKQLTKYEKTEKVQAFFDFYFENGSQFLALSIIGFEKVRLENKKANLIAYLLHQATESFYSVILLVYSGYKPKAHNLDKFRKLVKQLAIEITEVFPIVEKDKHELFLFDLLKRSYIAGKYKRNFEVSYENIEEIIHRVTKLKNIAEQICKEKIATL